MADPNTTLTGCSGSNYRFGTVPFTRSCCIPGLDKAVLRLSIILLNAAKTKALIPLGHLDKVS